MNSFSVGHVVHQITRHSQLLNIITSCNFPFPGPATTDLKYRQRMTPMSSLYKCVQDAGWVFNGVDKDPPTDRIITFCIKSERIMSERINTEHITSERIMSERIKLPNV
jgi:hypothetical protein